MLPLPSAFASSTTIVVWRMIINHCDSITSSKVANFKPPASDHTLCMYAGMPCRTTTAPTNLVLLDPWVATHASHPLSAQHSHRMHELGLNLLIAAC
jgi:hypothetical protein